MLMSAGKNNFSKILLLYIHPQWVKNYILVPKAMNNGCSTVQFWAYGSTEKVAGSPPKKLISLIYVLFAYIYNN